MSIAEGFLHPLKVVCCAFGSVVLAGCSAPSSDRSEALESQSGALSTTMVRTLGFESLSDWHVLSSTPTLALSTTRTEGNSSLSVKKGGWMQVESRVLGKEQPAPTKFSYSVRIPAGATGWLGDTQLSINAPSVGIYSQVVGTAALSGPGQFQRVQFTLSNALKAQLNNNYTDLQFRITLNVPSTATQAYLLDQLTFGSVCDSNPVIDDGNPCTDDSCDPVLGVRHLARPNGSACSDGNACTQVDTCSAGTCVGANPVACAPANRCHDAGECDWVTGACDYPIEDDPTSCREHLTIQVPPPKSYRTFVIVANGELDLRDQVAVRAPVANMGGAWTHIGNDLHLTDVYSKPNVTVGDRSELTGMLRTGAGSTISNTASVGEGVSPGLFVPPSEHTISFDLPADGALANVTVEVEETSRIAPGPYGHLRLQPRAQLLLSSGDYYFESFDALEPDSALVLNEHQGPVRIFVGAPFTFRSKVTSNSPPSDLTLGVLGTGTVRFERPFEGTLIAPDADLVLAPLNGDKHRARFFAKNITVDAGVIVEAPPRDPRSCQHSEFRDAGSAECSGHNLEIVAHQGVTRALFEGEEALATGKRVEAVEDFTFTFNQPVTPARARSAVQILSVSCPAAVLKAGCTHDVTLEVEAVGTDGKSIRFSNENDPFLPGCQYELRIDEAPLTSGGECLAEPAKLAFLSLSPADGPVLAYETSEVRYDPRNRLVAALELEKTISWQADELFRERLSALGLRPGIDSFAPDGPVLASGYARDAETIFYRQQVDGVPVSDYGYSVQRDRTTGRVLEVTGRVATAVARPGSATMSEAAALATARAEVQGYSTSSPPARLELVPTYDGTKAFKLAYRFVLSDARNFIQRRVDIDAMTGSVLNSIAGARNVCKSINVSGLVEPDPLTVTPVTLETLQHQHGDFDPATFYVTEYMRPNGPRAFALDSRGGEFVSGVPLGRPSLFTECPAQRYPNVVELPGNQSDPSWDSETFVAAQLQLAAESCLDYFANRPKPFGLVGAQWSGMDGQGLVPVEIQLDHTVPTWNGYYAPRQHPDGPAIQFNPAFFGGAMIDFVCHEFMHGVWDHFGYSSTAPEAAALNESVADIFGAAAEYAERQDETSLWCMIPDDLEADCTRWMDAPVVSTPPQPYVYEGPNYCNGKNCDEHINGGVSNYWFFLVSRGGSTVGVQGCGNSVTPLDPDPKKAVDMATEIMFVALRDRHYIPGGGFHDMANATISASRQLYGDGPVTDTVIAAWHALKVWEAFKGGADPKLQPARDAVDVNPWKDIRWRLDVNASESDIQIDINDTFDSFQSSPGSPGSPLISRTVPNVQEGSETLGTLSIALEPNQKYYWRVRPHSTDTWGNCQAIHWFTTGDLPAISSIDTGLLEDVEPGFFRVKPEQIPHAKQFKVQLSDHDTNCKADPSAEEETIDADDPHDDLPAPSASFVDLQPEREYWVNVQPIGPENVDGAPAPGACYAQMVHTLSLDAPSNLKPQSDLDDWIRYFDEQPEFEWRAAPGTREHVVRVYPIDEAGNCEFETLVGSTKFEDLCDSSFSCPTSTDVELSGVRNPLGYCWEVTGFSTDGHESSTVEARLHYRLPGLSGKAPGIQLGFHEMGDPSPLEGNSYDQPVTLSWDPEPAGILGYQVRVGNYHWAETGRNTPATCYFGQCGRDPRNETVPPTLVTDSELELPGELSSRGRYCWSAWSVLEDPEHPGEIWSRQPFVPITVDCYTSGPSKPDVTFTVPASGDHITEGETIQGKIEVAFVPDGQIDVDTSHPTSFDMSQCQTTGPYYSDVYDCVITFSASGVPEGNDFEISVKTYNSPEVNPQGPVPYDDLGPIHEVDEVIHVDACGGIGDICCADRDHRCDSGSDTYCNKQNVCESCGGLNQDCCKSNRGTWCNNSDELGCDDGTCRPCGANKVCCGWDCPENYECISQDGDSTRTRCRHCGGLNEPCCDINTKPFCGDQLVCQDVPPAPGDIVGRKLCKSACPPAAPVSFTAPVNVLGEPHYADENANPLLACEQPGLFGKLSSGLIMWDPPSSGEPAYYLVTYHPSGEQFTVSGGSTAVVPPRPQAVDVCGVIGVTIQAVNGCDQPSAVGPESGMYTLWN